MLNNDLHDITACCGGVPEAGRKVVVRCAVFINIKRAYTGKIQLSSRKNEADRAVRIQRYSCGGFNTPTLCVVTKGIKADCNHLMRTTYPDALRRGC